MVSLLTNHLFYQLGEITGYLDRVEFADSLAILLRAIKMAGRASFSSRINPDTSQLKQNYDPMEEYKKSTMIQNFTREINSRSPDYPKLPSNEYVLVYRSISISSENFQRLAGNLIESKEQTKFLSSGRLFPHPIPFSASWTSKLSEEAWSHTNLTLEIKLPLNYSFLPLSCPPFIDICDTCPDRVESMLRRFIGPKIIQILNQSQLELLIMPSYFKITGDGEFEFVNRVDRQHIKLTVEPVSMTEADQKRFLRHQSIDEEIIWDIM